MAKYTKYTKVRARKSDRIYMEVTDSNTITLTFKDVQEGVECFSMLMRHYEMNAIAEFRGGCWHESDTIYSLKHEQEAFAEEAV